MAKIGFLVILALFVACTHGATFPATSGLKNPSALDQVPQTEIVGIKDALGDFLDFLTALTGVDVRALIIQFPQSIVGIMAIMDYANSAYTQLLIDSALLPRLNEIINRGIATASAVAAPVLEILNKIVLGTATALDLMQLSIIAGPTLTKLQAVLQNTILEVDILVDELMVDFGDKVREILTTVLTEIWLQLEPLADILRPILPGLPGGFQSIQ